MKNARFWEFINGGEVKLTLRPGQRIDHWQGGPTEEGWHSTATTWRLSSNGRMLEREVTEDGVDCDGRLTNGRDFVANADPADFVPMYYSPELRRPHWKQADAWQRDQFAEAAGY